MLIDTHCHLDFPEFDQDRDVVVKRAQDSGIGYIINIGSSLAGSIKSLELSQQHDFIYATVGLHPYEADRFNQQIQSNLEDLAKKDKVVAIGEIGLDYFKNYSKTDSSTSSLDFARDDPKRVKQVEGSLTIGPEWNRRAENQRAVFVSLLELAKDLDLPIVIHNRQAQADTLKILKNASPLEAVVHCFSGDEVFLKECLDLGFFVSFTCNITYNKASSLRNLVKITPLEKLLLETDAPFLPPQGMRGKRNEPAYIKYLAEEVARIKEISIAKVAEITSDNAKHFFKIGS